MELNHKIYKLVDATGKPAKFSKIEDLKIMIEGWDFNIPVLPTKKEDIKFFNDVAKWEDDSFEAFSIFEKFAIDSAGYLVHETIHISFMDSVTRMEFTVKEIVSPPFLMLKAPDTMNIDDENHNVLTHALKKLYSKAIESAEAEVTQEPVVETLGEETSSSETAPVEPVVTEPVATTEPTPEPVVEEPVAIVEPVIEPTPEPVVEEPAATVEPVIEPVVTEPVAEEKPEVVVEETTAELEENVIPKDVMDKYEGFKKDLIEDRYKEHVFKNYRFFVLPGTEVEGSDVYLLLLTPKGVLEVQRLALYDEEDKDTLKYKFKLNGEKKSLYLNKKTGEMVVKKPKKKEEA